MFDADKLKKVAEGMKNQSKQYGLPTKPNKKKTSNKKK